jgi:uncharacterized membrane protein YdjX (TVP38/TMEM64 family)
MMWTISNVSRRTIAIGVCVGLTQVLTTTAFSGPQYNSVLPSTQLGFTGVGLGHTHFVGWRQTNRIQVLSIPSFHDPSSQSPMQATSTSLSNSQNNNNNSDDPDAELKEEANRKIWQSRRKSVRWALKQAENIKNYRLYEDSLQSEEEGMSDGETKDSKAKSAVTITAFVVTVAAIVLRVGGRAALVSTLGLDFATNNPGLKDQLDQALTFFDSSLGPGYGSLLFVAAWTLVKVFCVDAFGVVLALSSGILFGGVLQGTFMSAFGATVGSTVAFLLAKADTPVRKKALELIDEYPALRGIEKVVAQDGIKAILTLRLAPVLPIPIGAYNYVYGVTNVPMLDFCAGIFLGSLKPYLLDSYLGYFGKQVVDGSIVNEMDDYFLLALLGGSVLIGVFASQLASETWDSVQKEMEEETKKRKAEKEAEPKELKEEKEPENFIETMKLSYAKAEETLDELIEQEFRAQLWNITAEELPRHLDPVVQDISSIENVRGSSFDFGQSIMEGLVFSPKLVSAIMKYCDPDYEDDAVMSAGSVAVAASSSSTINIPLTTPNFNTADQQKQSLDFSSAATTNSAPSATGEQSQAPPARTLEDSLGTLTDLRTEMAQRLDSIEAKAASGGFSRAATSAPTSTSAPSPSSNDAKETLSALRQQLSARLVSLDARAGDGESPPSSNDDNSSASDSTADSRTSKED